MVPEGQGDEPRIALDSEVIEFINSSKVPNPPALNAYQCERRKGHIIMTVDIHPGVTPMFMECKYEHCPGTAGSLMYPWAPLPEILKKMKLWIWYRPSANEFASSDLATQQHVLQGGLSLRAGDKNFDQFMEEWNAHH